MEPIRRSARHTGQPITALDVIRYTMQQEDPPGFEAREVDQVIGRGVFTTRKFRKGDYLLEYRGHRTCHSMDGNIIDDIYCLEVTSGRKTLFIDAKEDNNSLGRLINDSITPNCKPCIYLHENELRALFVALEDIPEGTELRYNYGGGPYPWRSQVKRSCRRKSIVLPDLGSEDEDIEASSDGSVYIPDSEGESDLDDYSSEKTPSPVCTPADDYCSEKTPSPVCTPPNDYCSEITSSPVCTPPNDHCSEKTSSPVCTAPNDYCSEKTSSPVCAPRNDYCSEITSSPVCTLPKECDSVCSSDSEVIPVLSKRVTLAKSKLSRNKDKRSTKRQACVFCKAIITKLHRHFESAHRDELEVQRYMSCPKNCKERKNLIAALTKKGNFHHNREVTRTGQGVLIPKYRVNRDSSRESFVTCKFCLGLYAKAALWRHISQCQKAVTGKPKPRGEHFVAEGRALLPTNGDTSKVLHETVLSWMRDDDIKYILQSDTIIKEFGCRLIEKLGNDPRFRQHIIQKMRELGRFLQTMRNQLRKPLSLEAFLYPENFETVIEAVREVTGFAIATGEYKVPSLALKLGFSLKQCAVIAKCRAIAQDNTEVKNKFLGFIELYDDQWTHRISSRARGTLYKAKFNRPCLIPLVKDVVCLNKYLQTRAEELTRMKDTDSFSQLLTIVLAEMICFNRRRCGETQFLKEEEYAKSLIYARPIDKEVESALSKFEAKLARSVHRIEVRGKRGKKVPILLTDAMKSHLDLVIYMRQVKKVKSPYVFAVNAETSDALPLRGSDCLRQVSKECGAKKPELLTSTNLRKQLGTLMQALNLTEDEQDIVASFMGHDLRVHRQFYRLTEDVLQAAKVTKILHAINSGKLQCAPKDVAVDEVELVEEESDDDDNIIEAECGTLESVEASTSTTCPDDVPVSKRQVSTKRPRKPWTSREKQAVEKHLGKYIRLHKVPGKRECENCIRESSALKSRSWKDVKNFIHNHTYKWKQTREKE